MKLTSRKRPAYTGNTERRVRCQSGALGYRCRLRKNYVSFDEFASYDGVYNLAHRLGYADAEDAWEANPVIEGSNIPRDFRKVAP